MRISSSLAGVDAARVRSMLAGLPRARPYRVEVKPLRYRTAPHLQAFCDFDTRTITLQVPEPFRRFREPVAYRARRIKSSRKKLRFRWYFRNVVFRSKRDVIRFLYCHEYHHYYQHDVLGRKGAAETACDRFALQHFRRGARGL